MDLRKFQEEVEVWSRRNFGVSVGGYDQLLGIVEEVGELCHAMLKSRQTIREGCLSETEARKLIKDAIGDLLVFTADYCARTNIDLAETVKEVWAVVKQRDWVKYPFDGKTR